jgi:hypothetical protein
MLQQVHLLLLSYVYRVVPGCGLITVLSALRGSLIVKHKLYRLLAALTGRFGVGPTIFHAVDDQPAAATIVCNRRLITAITFINK